MDASSRMHLGGKLGRRALENALLVNDVIGLLIHTSIHIRLLIRTRGREALLGIISTGDILHDRVTLPNNFFVIPMVHDHRDTTIWYHLAVPLFLVLVFTEVEHVFPATRQHTEKRG